MGGETPAKPSEEDQSSEDKGHGCLLAVLFCIGALVNFGFRVFIMMGTIWTYKKFSWGASMYGFVTSGVGAFGITSNIVIYPKVLKKLGVHWAVCVGSLLSTCAFAIMFLSAETSQMSDPRSRKAILTGPLVYICGITLNSLGSSMMQASIG